MDIHLEACKYLIQNKISIYSENQINFIANNNPKLFTKIYKIEPTIIKNIDIFKIIRTDNIRIFKLFFKKELAYLYERITMRGIVDTGCMKIIKYLLNKNVLKDSWAIRTIQLHDYNITNRKIIKLLFKLYKYNIYKKGYSQIFKVYDKKLNKLIQYNFELN
jgi:hypothetical protein